MCRAGGGGCGLSSPLSTRSLCRSRQVGYAACRHNPSQQRLRWGGHAVFQRAACCLPPMWLSWADRCTHLTCFSWQLVTAAASRAVDECRCPGLGHVSDSPGQDGRCSSPAAQVGSSLAAGCTVLCAQSPVHINLHLYHPPLLEPATCISLAVVNSVNVNAVMLAFLLVMSIPHTCAVKPCCHTVDALA